MYEGWLWLSILKIAACPSPMSITPAFSPGPQITHGASVGSFLRWRRELLYEQCSDHMTEKMPSSTRFGARPNRTSMIAYSWGERPCSATTSGLMLSALWGMAAALSGEVRVPLAPLRLTRSPVPVIARRMDEGTDLS